MAIELELHGLGFCPFFWRTRIAAAEKGVKFDWLPFDAAEPDPRLATHNPERRSPLLWQDGWSLVESSIIAQYIDEAFEGPPLQPRSPRERAASRLATVQLDGLKVHGRMDLTPEAKTKAEGGLRVLESKLESSDWLGGLAPSLADIDIWPLLTTLAVKGVASAEQLDALPRVRGYWGRVQERSSYATTRPDQGPRLAPLVPKSATP